MTPTKAGSPTKAEAEHDVTVGDNPVADVNACPDVDASKDQDVDGEPVTGIDANPLSMYILNWTWMFMLALK